MWCAAQSTVVRHGVSIAVECIWREIAGTVAKDRIRCGVHVSRLERTSQRSFFCILFASADDVFGWKRVVYLFVKLGDTPTQSVACTEWSSCMDRPHENCLPELCNVEATISVSRREIR